MDWQYNADIIVKQNETLVISDNYVLEYITLYISGSTTPNQYTFGGVTFKKVGKVSVGGNLLLTNAGQSSPTTYIQNDGILSVAGGIILDGDVTITGTGIII